MSKTTSNTGSGLTFATVLFLIFMTLKLCHVIEWSWWWVTAPLWIPFVLALLILIVAGVIYLIARSN